MNQRLCFCLPFILIWGLLGGCATSIPTRGIHFFKAGETEIEGIAPTESTEFEVPFHLSPRSAMVVDLKLNDRKTVSFWLDTGNPTCVMDNGLANDLRLRKGDQFNAIHMIDIGENKSNMTSYFADSVLIGNDSGPTVRNVRFFVQDTEIFSKWVGENISGIIGMNLFRPFKFTIDNARKVLRFRIDNSPEAPAANKIRFDDKMGNAIVIPIKIKGKTYEVQVDTGCLGEQLKVPDEVIAETRVPAGDFRVLESEEAQGGGAYGKAFSHYQARVSSIQIGPVQVDYLFATTMKRSPVSLLGIEFLKHFNMTIDYYNRTVELEAIPGEKINNNRYRFGFRTNPLKDGLRITTVIPLFKEGLAGLQKGDKVVQVNGISGSGLELQKLIDKLANDNAINTMDLGLSKSGDILPITIHKHWTFPPLDREDQSSIVSYGN